MCVVLIFTQLEKLALFKIKKSVLSLWDVRFRCEFPPVIWLMCGTESVNSDKNLSSAKRDKTNITQKLRKCKSLKG